MKKETSFVFTGDIGFDKYMDGKWNAPDLLSKDVLDFLHSADHVVINVEGPVADLQNNNDTEGAGQLIHTMNPSATKVFEKMGADIWNICNNFNSFTFTKF